MSSTTLHIQQSFSFFISISEYVTAFTTTLDSCLDSSNSSPHASP